MAERLYRYTGPVLSVALPGRDRPVALVTGGRVRLPEAAPLVRRLTATGHLVALTEPASASVEAAEAGAAETQRPKKRSRRRSTPKTRAADAAPDTGATTHTEDPAEEDTAR